MVTIEQEMIINLTKEAFDGRNVDIFPPSDDAIIRSSLDKVDALEREIEQLKEMIKR